MNYFAKVIKLDDNITKSKNKALKEALKSPYDYFFLTENNCKILDDTVYDKFIECSKKTGIQALMWGEGGLNKKLPFEDDPYIVYYSDFATAFTMYTREAIEKVGLLDEEMPPNTWQEIEHAKRIGDNGMSSPFGMFASPRRIDGMLSIKSPKDEFKNLARMEEALRYWQRKDGEEFPIEIKDRPTDKITEMI